MRRSERFAIIAVAAAVVFVCGLAVSARGRLERAFCIGHQRHEDGETALSSLIPSSREAAVWSQGMSR